MGRRSRGERRQGISRRRFLKTAGAASAALGLPLIGAAQTAVAQSAPSGAFRHGVASGDPLSDRVILWTRVTTDGSPTSVAVEYEVSVLPDFSAIVASGSVVTGPERDYTVKIDQTGLRSNTTYYYRFRADGQVSAVGRTRTLPVAAVERLRLGVVSCSNYAYGYFNAYARLAERADLDLILHLGDYIYEYGAGEYGAVRPSEPAHEIVSLADYRARHAQYKTDPDLQALHRQHPVIAIWDDHESANNAWMGGAENHDPATEGDWSQRVAAAMQAYYEWLPIRVQDVHDLRRAWRSFRVGDLAEIFVAETRLTGRDPQLPANGVFPGPSAALPTFTQTGAFADPRRQMLGEEQEAWLLAGLRTTSARWKLLGQQVMFAPLCIVGLPETQKGSQYINTDAWDGYHPARKRLLQTIAGERIDNVVVLTGDIHTSWAADLALDPFNPDVSAGGYDPRTGRGSKAVEFVTTSVTSPGLDDYPNAAITAKELNPHFKYAEVTRRGYLLLDVSAERVSGEWWFVDTVAVPSTAEQFAAAWQVRHGQNRLRPSQRSEPKSAPPPAP